MSVLTDRKTATKKGARYSEGGGLKQLRDRALSGLHKALGSIPSTGEKETDRQRRGRRGGEGEKQGGRGGGGRERGKEGGRERGKGREKVCSSEGSNTVVMYEQPWVKPTQQITKSTENPPFSPSQSFNFYIVQDVTNLYK